jgi:CRAL/TRIO domain
MRINFLTFSSLGSEEKFDLSVIPNVIALLRSVVDTLQDNYPEIFSSIDVTPASWFFKTCFSVTSRVLDPKYRYKLQGMLPLTLDSSFF